MTQQLLHYISEIIIKYTNTHSSEDFSKPAGHLAPFPKLVPTKTKDNIILTWL